MMVIKGDFGLEIRTCVMVLVCWFCLVLFYALL